jgi:hypothetical protein
MSTPDDPPPPIWTRRGALALIGGLAAGPGLPLGAEPRPKPRPEPEDRPGRGAPVFVGNVFERDVFE